MENLLLFPCFPRLATAVSPGFAAPCASPMCHDCLDWPALRALAVYVGKAVSDNPQA